MTPDQFLVDILDPGLVFLASIEGPIPTDDVRRFLLCVALQESGATLTARYQNSPSPEPGPARGWYQFESGGGVKGVLTHGASSSLAKAACNHLHVVASQDAVWRALEGHDRLATVFARLLLFTDTHPVPTTASGAWDCYCNRLWRPGKPHPAMWVDNWRTADETVRNHQLTDHKPGMIA